MKKPYITPHVFEERFEANEYVAACVEATATCAIPGTYNNKVGDGTDARNNHGICGNDGAITFKTLNENGTVATTASGLEYHKEHGYCKNRPITNLTIGADITNSLNSATFSANLSQRTALDALQGDHYYTATWTSNDYDNKTGSYTHYGLIHVTYINEKRPNHS